MLFSELYKFMMNKVTFAGCREGLSLQPQPPRSAPVNPFNVDVVGDGCPVHQTLDTNVTAAAITLTDMQENLALNNFIQYHSTLRFWQQVNTKNLKDQCTTHFCE